MGTLPMAEITVAAITAVEITAAGFMVVDIKPLIRAIMAADTTEAEPGITDQPMGMDMLADTEVITRRPATLHIMRRRTIQQRTMPSRSTMPRHRLCTQLRRTQVITGAIMALPRRIMDRVLGSAMPATARLTHSE